MVNRNKKRKVSVGGNRNGSGNGGNTDNPLAAARRVQQVNNAPSDNNNATTNKKRKNSVTNNKATTKAEQIWHRRMGGGYQLFVDYYVGQPKGIVISTSNNSSTENERISGSNASTSASASASASVDEETSSSSITTIVATVKDVGTGAGLSRAAIRRRRQKDRKKKKNNVDASKSSNSEAVIDVIKVEQKQDPISTLTTTTATNTSTSPSSSLSATTLLFPIDQYHRLLYKGRLLEVLLSNNINKELELYHFLLTLSKPLPLTFRFRKHHPLSCTKQKMLLQTKIQKLRIQLRDEPTFHNAKMQPVPYDAPTNYIYQAMTTTTVSSDNNIKFSECESQLLSFALDKNSLKQKCPALKEFLNTHTKTGLLARQELGSMLPVWILEKVGAFHTKIKQQLDPLHQEEQHDSGSIRVLDMCASPGSKTLQVAEELLLLVDEENENSNIDDNSKHRVRANDINGTRLESLKEAIERSGLFSSSIIHNSAITSSSHVNRTTNILKYSNKDASKYPIPSLESKKYQIILCDVPCSGDGTCRKDLHIIKNWIPSIGNTLHTLQKQILVRALHCVALHGYVCYSTCSLNPVEDEAVVHGALQEMNHKQHRQRQKKQQYSKHTTNANTNNNDNCCSMKYKIVQVSKQLLNGLILHPGVSTWKVADFNYNNNNNNNDDADDDNNNNNLDDDDDIEERKPQLCWYESYEAATTNANNNNGHNTTTTMDISFAVRSLWPPSLSASETATATTNETAISSTDDDDESTISSKKKKKKNKSSTHQADNNNDTIPLHHCLRLFPQDQDTGGFFISIIQRIQ